MPDSSNIQRWIEYAKNDLLVAKDLQLQKAYVYRAVLTHCQQCIEKYLKAFLMQSGESVIRTHDLIYLNKMCQKQDSEFSFFDEDFAWLSAVYIESRYPDDFEDIDKKDAELAIEIASRLEEFIKTRF